MNIVDDERVNIAPLIPILSRKQEDQEVLLSYRNINDQDLAILLPEKYGLFPDENDPSLVGRLIFYLGTLGLIDRDYSPKFNLGPSIELAALKKYGKDYISKDTLSVDNVIQIASNKKTEFENINIDLFFKADKKHINNAICRFEPKTFLSTFTNDINVAIRIGSNIVQVNLVDVSNSINESQKDIVMENRETIGRFKGTNEISNVELLQFIKPFLDEVKRMNMYSGTEIKIDLKRSPNIELIEKVDSMFCQFRH